MPYDIGDTTKPLLDEEKIQNWIKSYALLTLTNASDWTFVVLREHSVDARNPKSYALVIFTHPKVKYTAAASVFAFKAGPSSQQSQPQPDIQIRNEGTLVLLQPLTDAAISWIDKHIDDPNFYCNALVVEARYAPDIITAMKQAGLVVA